jgi:hypothetical protein
MHWPLLGHHECEWKKGDGGRVSATIQQHHKCISLKAHQQERVPATPPVELWGNARTVLALKGSLRRAKNGAPLPAARRSRPDRSQVFLRSYCLNDGCYRRVDVPEKPAILLGARRRIRKSGDGT